jgi:hypothetical protein
MMKASQNYHILKISIEPSYFFLIVYHVNLLILLLPYYHVICNTHICNDKTIYIILYFFTHHQTLLSLLTNSTNKTLHMSHNLHLE